MECYKNIEDVKVGDLVKTYDLEKRGIVEGRVTKVFHHSKDEMGDYYVVINDALRVTPNHLLYVNDGWLPAGMIKVGDKLFGGVRVESVQRVYEKVETYDLEVEGEHNYVVYAGKELLAHNQTTLPLLNEPAIKGIGPIPPPNWTCLLAGTKVAMADGSYKNIEDVKVGDIVKSYDERTGKIKEGVVTKVFHHSKEEMGDYYVVINDVLRVTPNHLLYVNDGWLPAGMIKVGDHLTDGVNKVKVVSVRRVYEKVPTYDLEVEDTHSYIVSLSEESIVSHNFENNNATIRLRRPPSDVAVMKIIGNIYRPPHLPMSKPPGGGGGGDDEFITAGSGAAGSGETYTGVTGGFYYYPSDNPSYVYYYPPRLPSSGINQLSAFGIHAISLPQNTRYVIHISSYEVENRTYNYTSKIELIGDDSNYGLVDGKKIEALKSLDYNKAKEALGIGKDYDFNITIVAFNGTTILSYGKDYSEASTLASYSRSVTIYPDTRAYMIVRVFK